MRTVSQSTAKALGSSRHPEVGRLVEAISTVVRGKREVIETVVAAFLAEGHILIEDVPGVGKTMLAMALARALHLDFGRVQFTADTLPSDILGITVYREQTGQFEHLDGPIFSNVVLADEINRAAPRTQSALLEAMAEGAVTIERETRRLPKPFLVIATQNPTEAYGTYPLPESQLDRFLVRLSMGYPGRDEERQLLASGGAAADLDRLEPVLSAPLIRELQAEVGRIHVADNLSDYLLDVAASSRRHPDLELGLSTRGAIAWHRMGQAMALVRGRDFVTPDDLGDVASAVLAHRILPRHGVAAGEHPSAALRLVAEVLDQVAVPRR